MSPNTRIILSAGTWVTAALFFCGLAGSIQAEAGATPSATLAAAKPDNADKPHRNKGGEKGKKRERPFPVPEQAWSVASIILSCPTQDRITLSVYPAATLEGYLEYGPEKNPFATKTAPQSFAGKTATPLTLSGLSGNTTYSYRLRYRKPGGAAFDIGPIYHFQTCRTPGSSFTFELQGDSHPERTPKQNDPVLYAQTLAAATKDRPDFYLCMGDDFSVDTLPEVSKAAVERVYLKQLPYLGLVANSAALFLVNGNHEQAARCNLNGTPDNVAVWAQTTRNVFFPQPAPDNFYSGDTEQVEHIGLLRDYYAWTWGDALFVVIDPYWHSKAPVDNVFGGDKKTRDLWQVGLGDAQYQWLTKTLEGSKALYKFVFAHHVNGTGRGGIECANRFEWGDAAGLAEHRPGWPLPIHQLLVKNHVTIFFQGHDHVFARQEKDGVIYQTLPDPANPNYLANNKDAYLSGDVLPGSGRIRVTVAPEKVRVEYVRSWLSADATPAHPDGEVAYTYEILTKKDQGRNDAVTQ